MDTPTLPFHQNFAWTFVRMDPVSTSQIWSPSFTRSWDNSELAIDVLGVANPPFLGNRRPWGSALVPFERALVSSYRLSVVTFPLSLCVSEILPIVCSSTPLFPTPSSLPTISPCSPGSRWMAFVMRRAKIVGLIVRAINLQVFQPICDPDPPTLDGQTDRQTDGRQAISIPRFAR